MPFTCFFFLFYLVLITSDFHFMLWNILDCLTVSVCGHRLYVPTMHMRSIGGSTCSTFITSAANDPVVVKNVTNRIDVKFLVQWCRYLRFQEYAGE